MCSSDLGFSPRLEEWLEEIYQKEGPQAAWRCFSDVVEYHIPKLARTELTGKDGQDLTVNVVKKW